MGTFGGQAVSTAPTRTAAQPATVAGAAGMRRGRAAALAALMALLIGTALYEGLPGGRSATAAAPRRHGFVREGLLALPAAARGPVSAAVGSDDRAYWVRSSKDGLSSWSAPQRLAATFGARSVSISSGATKLALGLSGVGFGSSLEAPAQVAQHHRANRVSYVGAGVDEWYRNGPLGLEQGFTLAHAPAAHASGPLTLALSLSGNARAALTQGGHAISFSHAGKRVLRYSGLRASDARGRLLHSWLSLQAGRIVIRVDARGAAYPLRIDPYVLKEQIEGEGGKDPGFSSEAGLSVAISGNGLVALVGAPYAEETAGGRGAVWVFTRAGSEWKQQGEHPLEGGSTANEFGFSVALSENGKTALIGSPAANGGVGAVWVYTASPLFKAFGEPLTGKGESGEGEFGSAVALSAEGTTAMIGARLDDGRIGSAFPFTFSGGEWKQEGKKFTGSDESGEVEFGSSVALSANGDTALIGAPDESGGGSAWVFTQAEGKWSQQGGKLTGLGEGFGLFGASVALSSDGNTALIGDPPESTAYVFTRSNSTWSQQGERLHGPPHIYFGNSVALSGSGNTALIGELDGAYAYSRSGQTWAQQGAKLTAEVTYGGSVALSADGGVAFVTEPEVNAKKGAALVFVTGPEAETGAASEVTKTSATVGGAVNPHGEEVQECTFEYGTSTAYGSSMPCAPSPGKGSAPVTVSAALSGLAANTTYHYRIAATNLKGTTQSNDATFTTLNTNNTGSTTKMSEPAKASEPGLSAEASGGTGSITVGNYGTDIGGAVLFKSTGKYIDVYRSQAATFTTIEFKECELGSAEAIWWDNPHGGWRPLSEPVAVFKGGCATVTVTATTKPDVAEMTGTRFGFSRGSANAQYGKCVATKDALYTEAACGTIAEKKGEPDHKGKYEWDPQPVECFPKKGGYYSESACKTLDEKKGAPKGKFEAGSGLFTASGNKFTLEVHSWGKLECESQSVKGDAGELQTSTETLTLENCTHESVKCSSAGASAGTIETPAFETLLYAEGNDVYTDIGGGPLMKFSCGAGQLTVEGEVLGKTTGDVNAMSSKSEAVFSSGTGAQELTTTLGSEKELQTTLTTTLSTSSTQAIEIDTKIKSKT